MRLYSGGEFQPQLVPYVNLKEREIQSMGENFALALALALLVVCKHEQDFNLSFWTVSS